MARPRSPHPPSTVDLAGGIGTDRMSQHVFRAPHPPHAQHSLSSTSSKPTLEPSHYTTGTSGPNSSLSLSPSTEAMEVEAPMAMQWTGQSDIATDHASMSNSNYYTLAQFGTGASDFYLYSQNGMSYNNNYNVPYASQCPSSSYLQSYPGLNHHGLPRDDVVVSESYPPAVYQIEPQKHYDTVSDTSMNDHLMQTCDDYDHHYSSRIKREEYPAYNSPYSDLTRASTPSTSSSRYATDEAIVDKEQPYAQLIYQALLQADGHTMVLRDIYEWFLKYTDKAAASETKGWQNSIRHNLSMNGAFEKVDQPYEDSRKGFMWRLTEQALREGVKSTTRYRSKQPNKRGNRTHHPQPQRQASGARGGHAARRSAHMKRNKRVQDHYRSDPYIARSVPSPFDPVYTHSPSQVCPHSPYFGSEMEYGYNTMHNSSIKHNGLELFPTTNQPLGAIGDSAYVLAQGPSEPLFTDSPTPSAEEPRTPGCNEVELGTAWEDGMGMGLGFQEYAG